MPHPTQNNACIFTLSNFTLINKRAGHALLVRPFSIPSENLNTHDKIRQIVLPLQAQFLPQFVTIVLHGAHADVHQR